MSARTRHPRHTHHHVKAHDRVHHPPAPPWYEQAGSAVVHWVFVWRLTLIFSFVIAALVLALIFLAVSNANLSGALRSSVDQHQTFYGAPQKSPHWVK